jgi:hypothetical protein
VRKITLIIIFLLLSCSLYAQENLDNLENESAPVLNDQLNEYWRRIRKLQDEDTTIEAMFGTTTGHDHDGTDSKKIPKSNIDGLSGFQIFTSDGNFTAPTDITKVYLSMVGGGGGGGGGGAQAGEYGGGGGGGGWIINYPYTVVAGNSYVVDIGAGGAGGAGGANGSQGSTGSVTTFDSTVSVPGGGGGNGGASGAGGNGGTGGGGFDAVANTAGGYSGKGGAGGDGEEGAGTAGAGGGTLFGVGGAAGANAANNTGGGGGGRAAETQAAGFTGGSGLCIVMY